MELYHLISLCAGMLIGSVGGLSLFYFGFKLGVKTAYSQANQIPMFEDDEGGPIDQDVTD